MITQLYTSEKYRKDLFTERLPLLKLKVSPFTF